MLQKTFHVALMVCVLSGCTSHSSPSENVTTPVDTLAMILEDDSYFEDSEAIEREKTMPVAVDETFSDFIFNFAGNEHFQRSRISFPLHFNELGDDKVVEKRNWMFLDLFCGRDYYTVLYGNHNDTEMEKHRDIETVRFENIYLTDSLVRTLVFNRQEGKWKLTKETLSRIEQHPLCAFLSFYRIFTNDTILREAYLSETIRYNTTDPEDDFSRIDGTISADQWSAFAPELPGDELTNIDYGQKFSDSQRIVLLKCGISNGFMDELHFRCGQHGWKLTAYEN